MNNEETVTTENEGVDCTQYPDCIPVAAPAQMRRIYPPVSARNTAVCYTRTSAMLVFPPSRSSSFISMFRSVRRDDHTVKLNVHRTCVHIRKNRRRLLYISLILHLSWKGDPLPSPYSSRYSPCSPLPSRSTAYTGPALAKVGMFFRQWSALPPNPWISTIGGPSLPCCIGEVGVGQGQVG